MRELTEEEMVIQYRNIVYYHAHRMSGIYEFDDLVSEGYIGLIKAFRTYNEDLGEFGTIAHRYVKGYMLKLLRKPPTGPHIPHGIVTLMWSINKHELSDQSPEVIAKKMAVPVNHAKNALLAMSQKVIGDDYGDMKGSDDLSHIDAHSFIENLTDHELYLLDRLSNEVSQHVIAAECGVSQMTISRQVKKLKIKYAEWRN